MQNVRLLTALPGTNRRKPRGKGTSTLAATFALLTVLAACSDDGSDTTEAGSAATEDSAETPAGDSGEGGAPDDIVFGTVPIAGTAAIYVGQEAGFFEEANLNVEIANAVQFEDIVPNVVNGTYNFGTVSVGTVGTAISENLPIKIAANTYHFNGEQSLMVMSDSDIQEIQDLEGKRLGLGALNNNFQAGLIIQFEEAGVSRDDVEFTLISPPQIPDALRNGTVDAGQINEPFITSAGDEFRFIVRNAFAPFGENACNNYVIVDGEWAEQNPELVDRFVEAYNQGAELAASDPSTVVDAVASYTEIEPNVLEQMYMPGFGTDLKKECFEATMVGMQEVGFVEGEVTVEEAFLDESS